MEDQNHVAPSRLASPNTGARHVVLLGRNDTLLCYRALVLRREGFDTLALNWGENDHSVPLPSIEVAILCHTLTAEDRRNALSYLRERRTSVRIIALDAGSIPAQEQPAYDAVVENLCGPLALVECVQNLLAHPRQLPS